MLEVNVCIWYKKLKESDDYIFVLYIIEFRFFKGLMLILEKGKLINSEG